MGGREYAEGDRDRAGEDKRGQRQFERGRQAARQVLGHRLSGGKRCAHVAGGKIAHIDQELLGQAFVQPELFAHLRDGGFVGGHAGEIDGRVAR